MIITLTHDDKYIMIAQLELPENDVNYIKETYKPNSVTLEKNATHINLNITSKYVHPLVSYLTYLEFKNRGKNKIQE